jgi:hypothetical protein
MVNPVGGLAVRSLDLDVMNLQQVGFMDDELKSPMVLLPCSLAKDHFWGFYRCYIRCCDL